jgi:hypothetical protein
MFAVRLSGGARQRHYSRRPEQCLCRAFLGPAHSKGSFFVVRFSFGAWQRSFHAVCGRHRELRFFAVRLPVTHNKESSSCVVIQGARQWEFTMQIATVCSLPCTPTKNAQQRLCRAFLGLCRALVAHGKPPVFRSGGRLAMEYILLIERNDLIAERAHYGRSKIPRVSNSSPSAKNRALGEANLHSGKGGTRGKPSSPSATLGEEGHSQKKICIWQQHWTEPFTKKLKNVFPECNALALGEGDLFPRVPRVGTRGRSLLPESHCSGTRGRTSSLSANKGTRGTFFPHFLWGLPTSFKTPCPNFAYFWIFCYILLVFSFSRIFRHTSNLNNMYMKSYNLSIQKMIFMIFGVYWGRI